MIFARRWKRRTTSGSQGKAVVNLQLGEHQLTICRKESTTKTVNNLLDKDPRWLRPKNREEMDLRIAGLSDCTKERKHLQNLRKFSQKSHKSQANGDLTETVGKSSPQTIDTFGVIDDIEIGTVEEFDMSSSTEWSETPLQDLFASAPEELLSAVLDPSSASFYHSQHTFRGSESTFPPQEPSVLDFNTSMLGYKDPLAAFLQSPPTDAAKHVKSVSTEFSTSSMKRRLSHYSDGYLQNIVRLLEGFSISDGSAASKTHLPSPSLTEADDTSTVCESTIRPSSGTATSSRSSGDGRGTITLPSAFLFLDRYIRRQGVCLPGLRSHDSGTCWCLEDLDPNSPLWVNRTGLVNHRISDPPESLKHLDIRFRDLFGNTVLHMLAARGADIEVIFKALKQGAYPNAKNSAGQTFAHLFTRKFLQTLAADRMVLIHVLRKLASFQFRFLDCDLFGRSKDSPFLDPLFQFSSGSASSRILQYISNSFLVSLTSEILWLTPRCSRFLPCSHTGGQRCPTERDQEPEMDQHKG